MPCVSVPSAFEILPVRRLALGWAAVPFLAILALAGCPQQNAGGGGPAGDGTQSQDPQIEVWRAGISVPSGSSCDFGKHSCGSSSDVTFLLLNLGTEALQLTGSPDKVTVTGADAAHFSITSQPVSPVPGGKQTSFTLRFTPPDTAERVVGVVIVSNDPHEPTFACTVRGEGIVPPSKIFRSGQTTSYAPGDDADRAKGVDWPSPRFVDHADGTVTDKLTGLMWQKSPPASTKPWSNAVTDARSLTLAGYIDWRLPNVNELESLVNTEQPVPATWLSTQGFIGIQSSDYWTSTTFAQDPTGRAWVVYMDAGGVGRGAKALSHFAWAVRDGEPGAVAIPKTGQTVSYASGDDGDLQKGSSWPSPRFARIDNNGITDNLTGLMWEESFSSPTTTWAEALSYAVSLARGGYSDWRLPNRRELESLINYGQSNPAGWLSVQGFAMSQYGSCWTSTTYVPSTGAAWTAVMDAGNIYYGGKTQQSNYAWAVRGGQ